MPTGNCTNGINIPNLSEDPCGGEKTAATCVEDSNTYTDLGLAANATQQQINQALYLAVRNLRQQLDNL